MNRNNILIFCFLLLHALPALGSVSEGAPSFPTSIESYGDHGEPNIWKKLSSRVLADPFNAVAAILFFAAIVHTFAVAKFRALSHRFEHEYETLDQHWKNSTEGNISLARARERKKFCAVVFHFLGEVEVVFGVWVIPLVLAITLFKGANTATQYISSVNFTEPVFVTVVMAIASSRPILHFAETCLSQVAQLGRKTPLAWWLSILTVGPLLGSFITEPAAMTICALLLASKFFKLHPSMPLRYATLGLLFVNISVGGTLTHFAAPPVVMVASKWGWDLPFMVSHFGWKAGVGILLANCVVFLIFRRELLILRPQDEAHDQRDSKVPYWIIIVHLLFVGFIVYSAHYPSIVILTFLFFLAFVEATEPNQDTIRLRGPVLVGFFLAGLVIHGGCQQWWIEPVLSSFTPLQMLFGATFLTAFNDNAAITYLASLVPNFSMEAKYAVVAGAVAGGGLTVIANAPNPAGQSILQSYFGTNGVDAIKLLLAALLPTAIMILVFLFLP